MTVAIIAASVVKRLPAMVILLTPMLELVTAVFDETLTGSDTLSQANPSG